MIKKSAKLCHSTINLPLFNDDDDVYVLQKYIIPELHILQGYVNHVLWQGLVPLLGQEKALFWPKKATYPQKLPWTDFRGQCMPETSSRGG